MAVMVRLLARHPTTRARWADASLHLHGLRRRLFELT